MRRRRSLCIFVPDPRGVEAYLGGSLTAIHRSGLGSDSANGHAKVAVQ